MRTIGLEVKKDANLPVKEEKKEEKAPKKADAKK